MDAAISKKLLPWFHLLCVLVALGALAFIIRRTELAQLAQALRSARIGWLLAAVAVYGLLFLPASWRWHLMLRSTGVAVHPGVTARMSLIGHFFYTIFFGVAGGDFAKSALYSRWYQLPLPDILAAAPLDRLLGLGGLVIFILLAFGFAAFKGAFAQLEPASWKVPPFWIILTLGLLVLLWLGLKRWGKLAAVARMWQVFKDGCKQLVSSWPVTLQGLACGLLVQVALASSLAFGLQAVSHSPVPWGSLMWTFPVISVVSALPFNIAGAGLREGAVLALLGLYGISAADAVAASLLTLVARLFWAAIGCLLLWRTRKWHQTRQSAPRTLSVIISTLNEAELLPETVRRLRALPEVCEILIADRGSRDQTRALAAQLGCRVLANASAGKDQPPLESSQPKGDAIVLIDADIWLPAQAGRAVVNCLRDPRVVGGGFWKMVRNRAFCPFRFRLEHPFRSIFKRRDLLRRALFVRREALMAIEGIPGGPTEVCSESHRHLHRLGRLAIADATVSILPRDLDRCLLAARAV